MSFSPTFSGLINRLSNGRTYFAHSSKFTSAVLLIALACFAGTMSGCGGGGSGPTAVLAAKESFNVPGRIELDGSLSSASGKRKLVSRTYTVKNLDTGETVYGPVTIQDGFDRGPLKVYPYADAAVTNGVKDVSGNYQASLTVVDDAGRTHTAVANFTLSGAVVYAVDPCDATCSLLPIPGRSNLVMCTLSTSCNQVIFEPNLLTPAAVLNPSVGADTTVWILAFGAAGGNGTDEVFGGKSGAGGKGGFAQTITTPTEMANNFGTGIFYYYLGQAGTHDHSGGSGGASTILSSQAPNGSLPHNEIVLIAGGGGGGGEGSAVYSGSVQGGGGGDGGFAYSNQVGKSATGKGSDAFNDSLNNWYGMGGGGTDCTEGVACGGGGYNTGYQGFGGFSGGSTSSPGPSGWINGGPDLANNAGKGANSGDDPTCAGGGGGGGYGGGGGGKADGTLPSGGNHYRCYGGGGGGSYALASTKTDGAAPTSYAGNSGNGEVIFVFNTDPL